MTLPAGQSTDDIRTIVVRSSTMVNLLVDENMIARRVLRDRATPRNTIGTYEYNPVNGGRSEDGRCGAASMLHVLYPDQIRRAASRKYELPVMNYSQCHHSVGSANNRLYAEFLWRRVIVRCLPCRACSAPSLFVLRYKKLLWPKNQFHYWFFRIS